MYSVGIALNRIININTNNDNRFNCQKFGYFGRTKAWLPSTSDLLYVFNIDSMES